MANDRTLFSSAQRLFLSLFPLGSELTRLGQALKFEDKDHQEKVRVSKSPADAKALGQSRTVPLRADWDTARDKVMIEALYAKFTQHKDIGEMLKKTHPRLLVEHTKNDSYWGDGGDGSGRNRLGYCLMHVRGQLLGLIKTETASTSSS